MTTFGQNMKLTADTASRHALHRALTEGLGCESMTPEEGFAVYRFADGFNLGVYFVPDGALSEEQLAKGPWLELCVTDLSERQAALEELGVAVVPYERDPEHRYFQLPGGPVFRLATPPS